MNFRKSSRWPLTPPLPRKIMLQFFSPKKCEKKPIKSFKICNINFWIESNPPPPPFGPFLKTHPFCWGHPPLKHIGSKDKTQYDFPLVQGVFMLGKFQDEGANLMQVSLVGITLMHRSIKKWLVMVQMIKMWVMVSEFIRIWMRMATWTKLAVD